MSTTTDADAETAARTRRARFEPLDAERIAPGMFEVERLGADGDAHVVDLREGACDCGDFTHRMGPAGGECYHIKYLKLIASGELCPHCGYETCRPSCIARTTETDTPTQ